MDMNSSTATTPFYRNLKRHGRRRHHQYKRLDVSNKSTRSIKLGGERKRSWKVKVMPKLKLAFKVVSPVRLLKKLWDGYMTVMLVMAGDVGAFDRNGSGGGKQNSKGWKIHNGIKAEQSEGKLTFEVYKAMKASQESGSYRN